jgi:hypothetical protein
VRQRPEVQALLRRSELGKAGECTVGNRNGRVRRFLNHSDRIIALPDNGLSSREHLGDYDPYVSPLRVGQAQSARAAVAAGIADRTTGMPEVRAPDSLQPLAWVLLLPHHID